MLSLGQPRFAHQVQGAGSKPPAWLESSNWGRRERGVGTGSEVRELLLLAPWQPCGAVHKSGSEEGEGNKRAHGGAPLVPATLPVRWMCAAQHRASPPESALCWLETSAFQRGWLIEMQSAPPERALNDRALVLSSVPVAVLGTLFLHGTDLAHPGNVVHVPTVSPGARMVSPCSPLLLLPQNPRAASTFQ